MCAARNARPRVPCRGATIALLSQALHRSATVRRAVAAISARSAARSFVVPDSFQPIHFNRFVAMSIVKEPT
jgi:hypothetical protein